MWLGASKASTTIFLLARHGTCGAREIVYNPASTGQGWSPRCRPFHGDPSEARRRRPSEPEVACPMITVRETGLVYRNPRPELRSRHTWHPTIVRFDDGEMLVTFDIAEADVALDYR